MKQSIHIAVMDLRRMLREKDVLFQMFFFPILFTFVFGMTFSPSQTSREPVRLVVENNDRGPLGDALIHHLPADEITVVLPAETSADDIQRYRRLIIPEDFSQTVVENPPGTAELILPENASSLITRSVK
ncbi:MAG TPA: hypothetical protein PLV45_13660, partial [bacterium]|nr:hypothetical protein [bacterium]